MTDFQERSNAIEEAFDPHQPPTLLVGLGGFGSRIADHVYGRVKHSSVAAFAVDTDLHDSDRLTHIPKSNVICIAQRIPVSECMHFLPHAQDWFPSHPLLFHKTLSEGAGQVRAVARLSYELSLAERRFDRLLEEVDRLAAECIRRERALRVSVIGTLVGGTASGIFLQIPLLIRERVTTLFPTVRVHIHGECILPATFVALESYPRTEMRHLEANAYAAMKELNAINQHFFSNAPSVSLKYGYHQDERDTVDALPYDYCFLYDRVNLGSSLKSYVEDAIVARLFSDFAEELNREFVTALRTVAKKRADNLYGTVTTETLSPQDKIVQSELFRSIINSPTAGGGRRIFFLRTPRRLGVDTALFPNNTTVTEIVDPQSSAIVVTELCVGLPIGEMEKLALPDGRYYHAYRNVTERLPQALTPHLDKNWHDRLQDIGEEETPVQTAVTPPSAIPKERFVFISYSSREIEIANQVKHVLETNGISCWMAPQSIPAGSDYGVEIPKAINECRVLLLLLSDASQNSNWVPKEVGMAIGKGKIVVPFQIDNAVISEAFNFYLTNSQRISAFNRMAEAYQELLNRLKDLLA